MGKAKIIREGTDGSKIAVLAFGSPVYDALQVGEKLDATVVNMRFVKPIDASLIKKVAQHHEYIITVEDNVVAGGAGSAVNEVLASNKKIKIKNIGLPDVYQNHASREELLMEAGLDVPSLLQAIKAFTKQKAEHFLP